MAQSINTSYAVIVLGDHGTLEVDDLAEKAAEQGAVIAETYSFEPGEPAGHDDLADVEAVVTALSRAIATGADLWVPFPLPDLGREEHLRRLSLVLQRHGLNMLMGRDLEPCTIDGGFSPIDFALRTEVRAVDGLDFAAIAGAGVRTLGAEIEMALREAGDQVSERDECVHRRTDAPADETVDEPVYEPVDEPADVAPVRSRRARRTQTSAEGEKLYSTGDVARFFGKPVQWVYAAMRDNAFVRKDGTIIEPIRVGKGRHRRFTYTELDDMVLSCYRRGLITEDDYLTLLVALFREKYGR
jgi:hypothetical protein